MNNRNRFLTVVVLLGLLFSFCKKKDSYSPEPQPTPAPTTPPKPYRTVYVSNELKEWGLFNVGSYWIYRDSITGSTDSVYVSSIDTTYALNEYTADSNLLCESINVNFKSNLGFYKHSMYSLFYSSHDIIFGKNGPPIFKLDTTIIPVNGIKQNVDIPTINVLGNNYSNVRYLMFYAYYSLHSSAYWIVEKSYFKKNVGLVKNIGSPCGCPGGTYKYLELVRYHVTQ